MKKRANSLFVLAMAGMLSFTSCKDEKKDDAAAKPMQHEMHQEDAEMDHAKMDHGKMEGHEDMDQAGQAGKAEFKDEKSKMIFESYLEVKNALVETNSKKAQEAAAKLNKHLGENKEIAGIAQELAQTADVNKQREVFSKLTAAIEPVLEKSISGGKIYKQFCPMAFEGKGDYWFSSSDQIRNPYYGDKMLKCGRVEKTIM